MWLVHGQPLFETHPPSFSAQFSTSDYVSDKSFLQGETFTFPFGQYQTAGPSSPTWQGVKWRQTFQFSGNKIIELLPPQRFPQFFLHQQVVVCQTHEPWNLFSFNLLLLLDFLLDFLYGLVSSETASVKISYKTPFKILKQNDKIANSRISNVKDVGNQIITCPAWSSQYISPRPDLSLETQKLFSIFSQKKLR